jgi:phospholipid/cholesterol/gamma-HCH transport system substrate-binding protein
MPKNSTLNFGTGAFVALGFAALLFLTTQTTSRGLSFGAPPHYDVTAKFDNIGDLRVGSPVSMAGVEIGRVVNIDFDNREYKAVVTMRMSEKFSKIPTDSDASIYTQGLLGGKFVGLTAGGAETYLKNGDHIDFTQSAFVLENLIGQLLATYAKSPAQSGSGSPKTDAPGGAAPGGTAPGAAAPAPASKEKIK